MKLPYGVMTNRILIVILFLAMAAGSMYITAKNSYDRQKWEQTIANQIEQLSSMQERLANQEEITKALKQALADQLKVSAAMRRIKEIKDNARTN